MPNEDLERYRRVAVALTRHGLTQIVDLLGLDTGLVAEVRSHIEPGGTHSFGVDLASTFEELGPTYIKLGQLLSTREDLVPPEVAAALARLQDHTPPAPIAEIRATIVAELGAEPEQLFAHFDDEPLACASIGQAHTARMKGGDEVVVKVRRPGAVEQVRADLRMMRRIAEEADRSSAKAHQIGLLPFVEQFTQTTLDELDYTLEADNARHFAEIYRDEPRIVIPRVHPKFSTAAVLTLDRMRGVRVDDVAELKRQHINRKRLAQLAATTLVDMVLVHRFFHADPHPGNMFVQHGGSIALIDFGMVGRVTEAEAAQLDDLIVAFVSGDAERLTDAVLAIAETTQAPGRLSLERELGELLDTVRSQSLADVELSKVGRRMLTVMRRHHLRRQARSICWRNSSFKPRGSAGGSTPSSAWWHCSSRTLSRSCKSDSIPVASCAKQPRRVSTPCAWASKRPWPSAACSSSWRATACGCRFRWLNSNHLWHESSVSATGWWPACWPLRCCRAWCRWCRAFQSFAAGRRRCSRSVWSPAER
ncbi:ABC1 kinase family protein [Pseudoclavibacter soli]|uniref:ABC1 kinase family protein n=1 Tax=Pseudoclavibacter soli TaxID=452623 RepID=UPI0003FDEDB0|nr:AarF/UbiB family protein [Pseudoclavibacter soli]